MGVAETSGYASGATFHGRPVLPESVGAGPVQKASGTIERGRFALTGAPARVFWGLGPKSRLGAGKLLSVGFIAAEVVGLFGRGLWGSRVGGSGLLPWKVCFSCLFGLDTVLPVNAFIPQVSTMSTRVSRQQRHLTFSAALVLLGLLR